MNCLKQSVALRLWSLSVLLIFGLLGGANAAVTAGKEYTRLNPPRPTETGKKIEVIEFFYYGCPHCFDLEPGLEAWRKKLPSDVAFRRVPGVFRDSWMPLTRLYYAYEALGLVDKLHAQTFNAIHLDNVDLSSDKAIIDWVAKRGVDRNKFTSAFNSFAVQNKAQRARAMTQQYGVQGVPTLIVDGKYMTGSGQAGGHDAALATVDQLIAMARAERKKR